MIASDGALELQKYRPDFRELWSFLKKSQYSGASVLGTYDVQLADSWQYEHKHLYLPDLFNTTVSDQEVESRLYSFGHLLSTSTEEFGLLLDDWYFLLRFVGCAKYQANSWFTPWPRTDYPAAAQARIARTPVTDAWHLELPLSEKSRLMSQYAKTAAAPPLERTPDIIVLNAGLLRSRFHPERGGSWRLAWSNHSFEVWIPVRQYLAQR
jgi:hypothetical protein